MKSFSSTTTATLLAVVSLSSTFVLLASAQSHIRCQNTIGGPCGDASRPREMNCCDYGYCQPWNKGYYQCLDKPELCPTQETDIDYYGNDLKTIYGIQPSACCDQCSKTSGCRGYTFVNENPDGKSACYLKSALTGRAEKKGAISGALASTPPPTPPTCQNTVGASCGNAQGTTCCPQGSFCQPWNSGYYQCVKNPQFCSTMRTDIDLYGNDLKTIYGILPSDCCDQCAKTNGCRAFTFVNENPDGKSACYLKSSASGQQVAKKGALSSVLIYDPIPTPTPPPVTPAPTPSPTGCQTPVGAPCGNAQTGPKCCNDAGFCQPWNAGYYQCIAKPLNAKCPTVVVGVDFYGHNIETKYGLLPDSCCDACYNHKDCRVFTFVNENADGKSACYLKSGLGEQRAKASAISGYKSKIANYP